MKLYEHAIRHPNCAEIIANEFYPYKREPATNEISTRALEDIICDTFFPEIDFTSWKLISNEEFPVSDTIDFGYSYQIFDRIR